MYDNNIKNCGEELQEEYTFPNLPTSSICCENIKIINTKALPHKIIAIATLLLSTLFGLLAFFSWFKEFVNTGSYDYELNQWVTPEPDYANAIIFCILFGISVIPCIISLIFVNRYSKQVNYFKRAIKINNQYFNFICQGYDKKEAYRLTLEWLDRQAQTQALNNVAAAADSAASAAYMATMIHNNHINRR